MKQTAVRWLELVLIWDPIGEEEFEHNMNCWKQAKEMEKEQIKDAYKQGTCHHGDGYTATEYYEETFNID